jgi:hypothetical protein
MVEQCESQGHEMLFQAVIINTLKYSPERANEGIDPFIIRKWFFFIFPKSG